MNKIEVKAFKYLIEEMGYSKNSIKFRCHASPDFITSDGCGYEIKRNVSNCIYFQKSQFEKLKNVNNVYILVFNDNEDIPISIFLSNELSENKIIDDIEIRIINGIRIIKDIKGEKTVAIEDDVHKLITDKQYELKKRGTKKEIRQIVNDAIKAGIDIVDDET